MFRSRHPRGPNTELPPCSTTPPQTRKRKATETIEASAHTQKQSKTKASAADISSSTALNTPPLTTMDSDDEFMSGLSSQDEYFGGVEESDDGSLGDGSYSLVFIRMIVGAARLTRKFGHRIRRGQPRCGVFARQRYEAGQKSV